jgi:hypothetical protein
MISFNLKEHIAASPSEVRSILLDHVKLDRFFDAKFILIRNENEGEIFGGKGAIRQVSMIGMKFQERIISADNNHISYQIIGNKPVADHRGDIHFFEAENTSVPKTEITYNLRFNAPWWLPSYLLSFFIKKDIMRALKKLEMHFEGGAV